MCGLIGLATGPRTARTEIFPSLIQRDSTRPYAVDDVPMAVAPQRPLLGGWQPPQIQARAQAKPPQGLAMRERDPMLTGGTLRWHLLACAGH